MGMLTRYERDAAIAIATAFLVSFLAGVFMGGVAMPEAVAYSTSAGLIMVGFGVYLAYRALRRFGGVVRSRFVSA